MKRAKKLTRRQKSIVVKNGVYPVDNWFCVGETIDTLTIINNVTKEMKNIPTGGR